MARSAKAPRPRGRPRDLGARTAILRAARALLAEGGPGQVTMEAVAARAGVGKPTVYRWWPDRHAVTMAALMDADAGAARAAPTPSLAGLRSQLLQIATRFATPTGRHITAMLAAADQESELARAFRGHFVIARRAEGKALLAEAIERGEVRADLDIEVALDQLYGAVFFRLLMGHAPLDAAFVDQVLAQALDGMRARVTRRRARRPG